MLLNSSSFISSASPWRFKEFQPYRSKTFPSHPCNILKSLCPLPQQTAFIFLEDEAMISHILFWQMIFQDHLLCLQWPPVNRLTLILVTYKPFSFPQSIFFKFLCKLRPVALSISTAMTRNIASWIMLNLPFRFIEQRLNHYLCARFLYFTWGLFLRAVLLTLHLLLYSLFSVFSAVLLFVFSVLMLCTTLFVDSWFNDGSLVVRTHDVIWSLGFFFSFLCQVGW